MAMPFNGSARPTLGFEVEYQLVDPVSGDLVQVAPAILEEADNSYCKPELLQSTLEVISGVCENVDEVRADIGGKLEAVSEVAARHGAAITCAGTHPFAKWEEQVVTDDRRYHRLINRCQWPARRLLIFGCHVHVGVPTGEMAIAVVNHMERWTPHLLALTASSPFWQGEDTGLASCRIKVFENLPTAGLPHRHKDWDEFERLLDSLIRAQAIDSIREIWWDIRPHPGFGTVEVRVCDGIPTLDEQVAIVALVQALIVHIMRQVEEGHSPPLLHPRVVVENKWRASRWSTMASTIVDEKGRLEPIAEGVERMLDELGPLFQELGSAGELPRLRQMVREGPSYARQRAVYRETNDLSAVVDCLLKETAENRPFHI